MVEHIYILTKKIGFTADCDLTPIDYLLRVNKTNLPIKVPKGFLELLFREDILMRFCYENNFKLYGISPKTDIIEE